MIFLYDQFNRQIHTGTVVAYGVSNRDTPIKVGVIRGITDATNKYGVKYRIKIRAEGNVKDSEIICDNEPDRIFVLPHVKEGDLKLC